MGPTTFGSSGKPGEPANAALVGATEAEFLARAATPALLLDLDVMRTNIATMQATARRHGKSIRPHMKAHKSSRIALLQMAAGAVGMSCATGREAEIAAQAGIASILLTTPIVTPLVLDRLMRHRADYVFAVDSVAGIDAIAATGVPAGVVIDINIGQNRTGVGSVAEAEALSRHVAGKAGLELRGVQAYYGHLQHVPDMATRRQRAADYWQLIAAVRDAVGGDVVTGGGTGTHLLDLAEGPFTEIQPGSYIFMDGQYGAVELGEAFGTSLSVLARVTSTAVPGQVVIDAGTKAMSTDAAPMRFLTPGLDPVSHKFMGDEHSALAFPAGADRPAIGAPVRMVTPHCDPTVNLHDHHHVLEQGRFVDIWPIEARGY